MVQVKIKQGLLEGQEVDNQYGGSFYSFKGIPYAQPPIGDLRFKAPQPPESWDGVRSAKEHGPVCIQYHMSTHQMIGKEDCLYLNVYTPDIRPNKPLPVMFYIHGGGFTTGSGNDEFYGPEFLIKKDIVLVTINYRLNSLGFLCLDSSDIPGNAGMKDQVAALRWVKDNIRSFGGDPENITIFGESAGGASVSWHLISPMTKGLFKRAIIQSGSANSYWASTFEPREKTVAFARKFGLDSEKDLEISNFLKSLPLENFIQDSPPITLSEKAFIPEIQFSIVSEKDFGQERFFYGDITEALRKGVHEDIEIISGYCEYDGTVKMIFTSNLDQFVSGFTQFRELFVPKRLAMNIPLHDQFEVGRLVKKHFYGDDKNITKNDLLPLIDYFGWDMFVYDLIQAHRFHTLRNKTYLYKFSCKSKRNCFKHFLIDDPKIVDGLGDIVSHADDLPYLFPMQALCQPIIKDSVEYKMIENTVTLWTNFVKYGNPTPDNSLGVQWAPYTKDNQEYLDIGEQLVPGTQPDQENYQFFDKLYKKYMPHIVV